MGDLAAFLNARLDEDEAAAMAATGTAWAWEATGDKDSSWAVGYVEGEDGRPLSGEIEHGQGIVIDGVCESINGKLADAAHIARHNPARVLREVEAGRAVIAMHGELWRLYRSYEEAGEPGSMSLGRAQGLSQVLRQIAAIYSDHPDYPEAVRNG